MKTILTIAIVSAAIIAFVFYVSPASAGDCHGCGPSKSKFQ